MRRKWLSNIIRIFQNRKKQTISLNTLWNRNIAQFSFCLKFFHLVWGDMPKLRTTRLRYTCEWKLSCVYLCFVFLINLPGSYVHYAISLLPLLVPFSQSLTDQPRLHGHAFPDENHSRMLQSTKVITWQIISWLLHN